MSVFYPSLAELEKWEVTGLLSGIEDDELKRKLCGLFENQSKAILQYFLSSDDEVSPDFQVAVSLIFPLIRRVFGSLDNPFKHDNWDVMTMPVGLFEDTPVTACSQKLRTRANFQVIEDVCSLSKMDPDIVLIQTLETALREELEELWEGKKVWIYIPFLMSSPVDIASRSYGLMTRFASIDVEQIEVSND